MVYLQDVYTVNQDAVRFSGRNRLDEQLGGRFATYVKRLVDEEIKRSKRFAK